MSNSGSSEDFAYQAAPATETAGPADDDAASDEVRARLMRQFEQWLDGMLAGESAPPVPEEIIAEALAETASDDPDSTAVDQYTLFAALTKLTGEIGVQGRTFKQLLDAMAPVGQIPAAVEQLEEAQHSTTRQIDRLAEQLRPSTSESSLPGSKDVLAVLFDLLERLERGTKTLETGIEALAASQPRGLFARLGGAQRQAGEVMLTMGAMHEAYALMVSRLGAAVDQWGIQRIGREGETFDPATMVAIEVDKTGNHPDGTIVDVLRGGYLHHGQVLTTAQVKVAKGE